MRDRVLIDTSAWIAYFQRGVSENTAEGVDQLLSRSDIFVPKIVLAELIQGAHSEKELSVIREFLGAFHVIGEGEDTWIEAGKLSYALRKKGKTVNLADCYIAVMAKENGCAVFTLDTHFKEMQKEGVVTLITV